MATSYLLKEDADKLLKEDGGALLAGAFTLTVSRAYGGTSAAEHASGLDIYLEDTS